MIATPEEYDEDATKLADKFIGMLTVAEKLNRSKAMEETKFIWFFRLANGGDGFAAVHVGVGDVECEDV